MDLFKRAYRDPKSPLTPVTPMPTHNAFNFVTGNPQQKHIIAAARPLPRRYSKEFLKIRDCFEASDNPCEVKIQVQPPDEKTPKYVRSPHAPQARRLAYSPHTPNNNCNCNQQQQQHYKKASPVPPPRLCPKTLAILTRHGQQKYASLFQREEIDLEIMQYLTNQDLLAMGICCTEDRMVLLDAAHYAARYIKYKNSK